MAKQAVGPVIRYLDKVVLVVAGGVFLYTVAMFGVMSPNKVGEPGEELGPSEVDQKVKVAAESLRNRLISFEPKPEQDQENNEPPPSLDRMAQAASDPLGLAGVPPTLAHRPVPFAPPVREVAGKEIQKVELVSTVPLDKPEFTLGRSGVDVLSPSELGAPGSSNSQGPVEDTNWVTVAAILNVKEQEALFANAGFERDSRAYVISLEVQRRELLANGEFSEWKTIPTVMPEVPPRPPAISLRDTDSGLVVSDESQRNQAEEYRELIAKGENQVKLLRPAFFPVAYGDPWLPPDPPNYSISRMDRDYGVLKRDLTGAPGDQKNQIPDENFRELMKLAQSALEQEDFAAAVSLAEAARSKADAEREKEKAEDLIQEIKRAQQRADEKAAAERLEVQWVWAHDAAPGSVRSGHSYQYRMRPILLNTYFGRPALLKDPQAATQAQLPEGDWSAPSDVVEIPQDTMFFIKRSRPQQREVNVEVFKWFRGVWLAKQFKIDEGMPIGDEQRVRVPPSGDRETVDFDTGARVVDIDYRRPYYERRGSNLRKKERTTAVVYVDATGRLMERIEGLDSVDPLYKLRRSQEYDPKQ